MNHEALFADYTKASFKTKFTREKAKEYGVAESDIICELLKSGYKLEELKRGAPSAYNSAVKKLNKWKKAGSPSDEDVDVLQHIKTEKTEEEREDTFGSDDLVIKQDKRIKELEGEKIHLEDLNEKQAEQLGKLGTENTRLRERIRGLEEELEEEKGAKKATAEDIEVINQLRNVNKELSESVSIMNKRIDELQIELNETSKNHSEVMMFNRKLEEQLRIEKADLHSEQVHLDSCYRTIHELSAKLRKAERYILNSLYKEIDDDEDGGCEE